MKERIKKRKGFTLIEIIAVLVILGILAAVAIPKYLDLQEEAEKRAAEGAVASAQSRLSMAYSKYLLANDGQRPAATDVVSGANGTAGSAGNCGVEGDFTVSCTAGSGSVTITAYRDTSSLSAGGTWKLPTN